MALQAEIRRLRGDLATASAQIAGLQADLAKALQPPTPTFNGIDIPIGRELKAARPATRKPKAKRTKATPKSATTAAKREAARKRMAAYRQRQSSSAP